MKIFLITLFHKSLALLCNNQGEMSLRVLYEQKEGLRKKMSALWDSKEKTEWSKEQSDEYEKLQDRSRKMEKDIKARIEYEDTFRAECKPEQREMANLQKKAGLVQMIKRQLQPFFPEFKRMDNGPIDELVQHRRSIPLNRQSEDLGGMPLENSDLEIRAAVDTSAGSGDALVQDTIYPQIIPNLYKASWTGKIGATFIMNQKGNLEIPGQDTKPASGFIGESGSYPEASIDFKTSVSLKPLKVGCLQDVTLQLLRQDETQRVQQDIAKALMLEWAEKVDTEFMYADGNPATEPKGLLEITGIQTKDASDDANAGSPLTFNLIKDCETLLEQNNQMMPGTWIISAKQAGVARKALKAQASGATFVLNKDGFGDMKYIISNIISDKQSKGTSGAVLSDAVLLIPESVVIVHWGAPMLSVDHSLGFKEDKVWLKVNGYCNIGLKRPKDLVHLKNLT